MISQRVFSHTFDPYQPRLTLIAGWEHYGVVPDGFDKVLLLTPGVGEHAFTREQALALARMLKAVALRQEDKA